MFNQLLSSLGIGGATIDTRLHHNSFMPGGPLSGESHIKGGGRSIQVNSLYLYVTTQYKHDDSYRSHTLAEYRLTSGFTIEPNAAMAIPFNVQLPYVTPLTQRHQRVYVRTGLDVASAIDPGDSDAIEVGPDPLMGRVLQALHNLGFQLRQVECEYNYRLARQAPFVQQFEFRAGGRYAGYLQELEVVFFLDPSGLEVMVEMDRRARGFAGLLEQALDANERYSRFRITPADLAPGQVEATFEALIQQAIR